MARARRMARSRLGRFHLDIDDIAFFAAFGGDGFGERVDDLVDERLGVDLRAKDRGLDRRNDRFRRRRIFRIKLQPFVCDDAPQHFVRGNEPHLAFDERRVGVLRHCLRFGPDRRSFARVDEHRHIRGVAGRGNPDIGAGEAQRQREAGRQQPRAARHSLIDVADVDGGVGRVARRFDRPALRARLARGRKVAIGGAHGRCSGFRWLVAAAKLGIASSLCAYGYQLISGGAARIRLALTPVVRCAPTARLSAYIKSSHDEGASRMTSAEQQKRILIFVLWFGPWPAWMRCFLESCRWNPTVDWLVIGDAAPPEDAPSNVRFNVTSFEDFRAHFSSRLKINARWTSAYKICEIDPALAAVYPDEIAGYDYWGYCDLDVIFGDIRRFYTPQVLTADCITTHEHIVAGHFTLFRNTPRMVNAFRRVPLWRSLLATNSHKSFDEQALSRLFMPLKGRQRWRRLFTPFLGGARFIEQFSTNIPPLKWIDGTEDFPRRWFWNRGRLTTDRSGDREFLYLHFSHWQSSRWTGARTPPWKTLEKLVRLDEARPERFMISAQGFEPLPPEEALEAAE